MRNIPTEEYREICKNYFRAMYTAGWSANVQADVPGCEEMCQKIRCAPESEIGEAYNGYVKYRNQFVTQQPPQEQNEPAETQEVRHEPDTYTKHDGLMADERLAASQQHTIIMLLSDIAESCRTIAQQLSGSQEK